MAVKIGHASIDEKGKIVGGKIGDQTRKEICIRDWYSKPWNVYLECTDEAIANKAATFMEQICNDDNYGYDQNERTTGYTSIVKNAGKVQGGKGEFDCSSLVATCYRLAGLNIPVSSTTRTLRNALLNTGKFVKYTDQAHLSTGNLSKRGGIYLKEGTHVVMVLSNSNPTAKPKPKTYTVVKGDNLTKISKKLGVSLPELIKVNNITNPSVIHVGQVLKIPMK